MRMENCLYAIQNKTPVFRSETKDGVHHGSTESWFVNGNIHWRITYHKGKLFLYTDDEALIKSANIPNYHDFLY